MWKRFFATLCACLIGILTASALRLQTAFPLSSLAGEYTYYLDTASSQARIRKTVGVWELHRVRGQSVVLSTPADATEIANAQGATLVKTERIAGIVNYYYYTPTRSGVCVDGRIVNLHIAVTDEYTIVGAPLIFGSF